MAAPKLTDLIALLARYEADGDLESPQVASAIQALSAAEADSDPGMATVLESLLQQRQSAREPIAAIDDLIDHINQVRLSAAARFHRAHQSKTVDLADFERLLGDLPLEDSQVEDAENSSRLVLSSAISLARDRRFLSSRRDLAPMAAAELDRQFDEISNECFSILENSNRRLALEIIDVVRQRLRSEIDQARDDAQQNVVGRLGLQLDQVQAEAKSAPPGQSLSEENDGIDSLQSLEAQFHAAETPLRQQQALDRICVWPSGECFEVILRLVESNPEIGERAGLILTCRSGPRQVAGWTGWENALKRATLRGQQDLRKLVGESPADLLLIWARRYGGLRPELITSLEQYCEEHATPVDEEDFARRWVDVLSASEINALLGFDFQDDRPAPETVQPIDPEPAAADEPRTTAAAPVPPTTAPPTAPPTPAPPPRPPRPASVIWQNHIQPWLTENWFLVAGIVMGVAGASLLSVWLWDSVPLIRFTVLPALLAGFTLAVASVGSWIERQDLKFRGTGTVMRGAAIALLPLNFMVVSLLAGEENLDNKSFFVAAMGLTYVLLFGWALRSWCRAVHEPLALPLAGALLATNGLVMIGPVAETLARSDWGGLPALIAVGFHVGFGMVAWAVVSFANRTLTPELATEKRVPWFVGATLAASFLQVFGWVHFQLEALPQVWTYSLLVILAGWLILFAERRAIELRDEGEQLGSESFLGYAMVLMGVLMGSTHEYVRVAALALAGTAWLYQAMKRQHELQYWIGLTLLSLSGASVALLPDFPRDPWLPAVGLLLALLMGVVHQLGHRRVQPLLARAALGMQPTLALLTAVVAILAQWQFRSPPLWTAGFLVATGVVFAWRAWRDQELRWVHSAMAIVGISLPYLGCVDMLGGQLHGNTMAFGLAATSLAWMVLVWLSKSELLLKARSTVLMVYGSLAVAAMVLRVLFESGTPADLEPWQQWMDYSGPLLMAGLLAIATYHTRSLLPATMATVIAVILFPELRARFQDAFESLGWGTGLGSAWSGLGLVLACFPLARAAWLRELDDGDLFFGRIPFPFRRHDHTLFTWPMAASAVFLSFRVDTWTVLENAIPGQSLARLGGLDFSLIPLKTAFAVILTGITWTLLAIFFRSHRGARLGTHLGWISLLAGLLLGNHLLDIPWHWSWPVLVTGLVLQGLDLAYSRLRNTLPGIEAAVVTPTRNVLTIGSLVLAGACIVALLVHDASEFRELAWLILFVVVQLARSGLASGHSVYGGFLFATAWISLLSVTTSRPGILVDRLSIAESFSPTLWLLLGTHAVHIGLEFARPIQQRLQPLLKPFLTITSLLIIAMGGVCCLDAITSGDLTAQQQWLMLAATLLAARNHGSAWLGLLGLLQAYVYVHVLTGHIESDQPNANILLLLEPWRSAALGLTAACLGYAGGLLAQQRPILLTGSFAQPIFRAPHARWLFAPAVALAVIATGYHTANPAFRGDTVQLWAPYLSAIAVMIVAWSRRSQELAWLAVSVLGLGNIHGVRLFFGDTLRDAELSDIHLVALGLVATLVQLTAVRELWRRDRVAAFVNRASLALAGLVLVLICFNYVTDPGLADIPWQRFVISGGMAYIAGLYFRAAARRPGQGEGSLVAWCEAGYHFGITLAIWCTALLVDALREPKTALFALALPVGYFHARAEQGFAIGSEFARRYRDSAATLSFVIIGLWVFRIAFHLLMFPDQEFDVVSYHANAPLVMLLSIVMLRLHGLGGTGWLAFYGGLALLIGSFFTLTWIAPLRPLDHPIAAAWCAIGLSHFWTLVSHQRSPLRTAVQQMGRIDGPYWIRLRRAWGLCLLIGTHAAVLWGLAESFGFAGFASTDSAEKLVAPLLLGSASVLIHMGIIRGSAVYFRVALLEIMFALHTGFLVESYLPKDQVIWAILGLWMAGLVAWEFASHRLGTLKIGTVIAALFGLSMAHIVFHHHPDSTIGLWSFTAMAVLAAWTPRPNRTARTGEETAAAAVLLLVPTWLTFFSQADLSDVPRTALRAWPLLATTAAIFATGSLCRWFQVRLLTGYDAWQRTQPRLFDQTLSLAGRAGATINTWTLWYGFVAAVIVQLTHYKQEFEIHEIVLLCTLYAGYTAGWYFEGQRRRTISAYIVLQLCVLGFFAVLRRQLINTMPEYWTPQYDVWASLVVSFGLCGVKQVIDARPREIRIPLLGTLLSLPVVALIWVIYNKLGSDVALLVVGLHSLMFTFLGKDDRESSYNIVAVGGFVTFVLLFFWSQLDLRLLHAFVIPVGLGLLVLLQLFRGRIDVETRNRIRLVTLLAMLASAGYYALVDDRHPVAFNLTLIVLSLVAMGLGSFLRIRLYLVLGFAAILVDVVSIVIKVVRVTDQTAQRATIGALLLVIGIGLVGGAIYYKTRRDQVDDVIDRWRKKLGAWE